MKKLTAMLLLACLLAGCAPSGATDGPRDAPPPSAPVPTASAPVAPAPEAGDEGGFSFADLSGLEFWFGSGAGAWCTVLCVHGDGAFEGEFRDDDMGVTGSDYPSGVRTLSRFTGKLAQPVRVNEYTYSAALEALELEDEPGTREVKDGVLIQYADPYGLDDAEELRFYLPGAPVEELPEEYLSWARGHGDAIDAALPFYGLYNVAGRQGFSSHRKPTIEDELARLAQEEQRLRDSTAQADSQAELNLIAEEAYRLWDGALNALWARLRERLDPADMDALRAEELEWIAYKEDRMEQARADVEGGSLSAQVTYWEGAELTKARVYELAEYFQDDGVSKR